MRCASAFAWCCAGDATCLRTYAFHKTSVDSARDERSATARRSWSSSLCGCIGFGANMALEDAPKRPECRIKSDFDVHFFFPGPRKVASVMAPARLFALRGRPDDHFSGLDEVRFLGRPFRQPRFDLHQSIERGPESICRANDAGVIP